MDARRLRAFAPLRRRDYRLLIAAVALSLFGSGMWTVVMVFQVLALADSPTALSAVAACFSGGLIAFALVGGVAADRLSKRAILVTVQGASLVAVAVVAALGTTGVLDLWHMAVASVVLGAGGAFFFPAYSAYLPSVLPAEELLAANGLEGALRPTLQQALGPAVAGMVVGAFVPPTGAFVVCASFAASMVLLLFVRPLPVSPPESSTPEAHSNVFADLREGFAFTVRTPWLLWTLLFACLMVLVVMGPIEVLLPFLVRDNFADGERAFGLLLTAFGVGGAIGSLAVSAGRMPRRYLTVMVLCWGLGSVPFAVLGYTSSFWVMATALFVVGLTDGAGMVIWGTLLQRRVPGELLGRVSSLDFFVSLALMPVSVALAGPLATVVPVPVIFVVVGTVPLVLALVALTVGRMPADEIDHPLDVVERVDTRP
ncbi:MFS transporter [Rhodococcus sp. HM1]|uniref:MFS transporter n=1 Tax=Rhodococcus sp. HM1 TaxID=2937759 RepID=UPI00200AED7D|nr:MFS transporter [Rhodococcus sp. HM1]MCK8671683.1 MFS transporter [Rhodococcus sp. HM1]